MEFVRGFRDYLLEQGFTEIRTPKLVAGGAEGGSNVFKPDYKCSWERKNRP